MDPVNIKTKEFWSGKGGGFWVDNQKDLDMTLSPLGNAAIKNIDLSTCTSVLDVGCGTGRTTIDIAKSLVGAGRATGLDISEPMLEKAKLLAGTEGIENVDFSCLDVQVDFLGEGLFDAVFSRFGVMFFEGSVEAFANIHMALQKNATLSFVCWQAPATNPWHSLSMQIVRDFIEIPNPPERSPGPFAFQESDYIDELLTTAGFREIAITPLEHQLVWFHGKDPHDAASSYLSINPVISEGLTLLDDEGKENIKACLAELFLAHQTHRGITFDSATWIVSALR